MNYDYENIMDDSKLSTSPYYLDNIFLKNKFSNHWALDDSVTDCGICKEEFSFFNRRHHCRICLNIFCHKCSSNNIEIPRRLRRNDVNFEYTSSDRVCDVCFKKVEMVHSVDELIIIFRHLKLNIKDLRNISQVCKSWRSTAHYYLYRYNDLHKITIDKKITSLEREMIMNNMEYYSGHRKLCFNLLMIEKFDIFQKLFFAKKTISCLNLGCVEPCDDIKTKLSDAIRILYLIKNQNCDNELIKKTIDILYINKNKIRLYLSFIISLLKYPIKKQIFSLIKKLILENKSNLIGDKNCLLIEDVYREIQFQNPKNYLLKYKSFLKKNSLSEKYKKQNIFFESLKYHPKEIKKIISPINREIELTTVSNYKQYSSTNAPVLISFNNYSHSILIKKSNLKNDSIICNLISVCNNLLIEEFGIDFCVVEYKILPINDKFGLIEIINSSHTVEEISYELKKTVNSYILNDDSKIIGEVRSSFTKSTAFFCVICYLFGIGDRILSNIMINKEGKLFHIDFEYIFGDIPKTSSSKVRMTNEIIDAIKESDGNYERFIDYLKKINTFLLSRVDYILSLIFINKISEEQKSCLLSRFYPIGDPNRDLIDSVEKQPVYELMLTDMLNRANVYTKKYTSGFLGYFW